MTMEGASEGSGDNVTLILRSDLGLPGQPTTCVILSMAASCWLLALAEMFLTRCADVLSRPVPVHHCTWVCMLETDSGIRPSKVLHGTRLSV